MLEVTTESLAHTCAARTKRSSYHTNNVQRKETDEIFLTHTPADSNYGRQEDGKCHFLKLSELPSSYGSDYDIIPDESEQPVLQHVSETFHPLQPEENDDLFEQIARPGVPHYVEGKTMRGNNLDPELLKSEEWGIPVQPEAEMSSSEERMKSSLDSYMREIAESSNRGKC